MPSPVAPLPLSRFPNALAVASLAIQDGSVPTEALERLRPAPTVHGGLSALLRDLQRGLPTGTEQRLLQALDQPGRPPPATLARFWAWASPGANGRTPLDELGRDRCALLCSLWSAVGQRVATALDHGDAGAERDVLQLLRDVYRRAAGGQAAGTSLAAQRAVDARLDAVQAYLVRGDCPARRRLGPLMLAWSAPAACSGAQLVSALAEGDAAANAYAPTLDDARLLAQRLLVRAWHRPVALAALRQLLPTFLQAADAAADVLDARNPREASGELMGQLDAIVAQPDGVLSALARDFRRLPWTSDPPLVRARCAVALLQLDGELRGGALLLVCARRPRLDLQRAACRGVEPGVDRPEALSALRRATLYGAFSVAVGAIYVAREGRPYEQGEALTLRPEEFFALVDAEGERQLGGQLAGRENGPRAAGLRVLNVHAGSERLRGPLGLLLVHAAADRPEPLDGVQMVALLELLQLVKLQGRAADRLERVRYGLLLRLLSTSLPDTLWRLRPMVRALFAEHSCSAHPDPLTFAQAMGTVEFVGGLLDRATTPGGRDLLCLAVAETTLGLNCRAETLVLAARVGQLGEAGWEALVARCVVGPSFQDMDVQQRMAQLAAVEALPEVAEASAAAAAAPALGSELAVVPAHGSACRCGGGGFAAAQAGLEAPPGAPFEPWPAQGQDDATTDVPPHGGEGPWLEALAEPSDPGGADAVRRVEGSDTAHGLDAPSEVAPGRKSLATPRWDAARLAMRRAAEAAFEHEAGAAQAAVPGAHGGLSVRSMQRAYRLLEQARAALRHADPAGVGSGTPAAAADGGGADEALHGRLHAVVAGGYQLERRERRTLQRAPSGHDPGAEAGRRAAEVAAAAARAAEAALRGWRPNGQLQALQLVTGAERTYAEARRLAADAAARRAARQDAVRPAPPAARAPVTAPGSSPVAGAAAPDAAGGVVAPEEHGAADTPAWEATSGYARPGRRGYVWRPSLGRLVGGGLERVGDDGSPATRLRHALWRELRLHEVPALLQSLEDCAARLDGWLAEIGHTSADYNLRSGELEELRAAATTLSNWQRLGARRPAEAAAVRLGTALVWQLLAPRGPRPYWVGGAGDGRHLRSLFGVLAGVGCPHEACRRLHLGQLARVWLRARQDGCLAGATA